MPSSLPALLAAARAADCVELDAERIYVEQAPFVHAVVARMVGPSTGIDPEDLTHDVFVIALRRPDRLQRDPRSWLFGIAVKVAARARAQARLRRMLGLESAAQVAYPTTPHQLFESAEDSRLVYRLLEKIGEKKRTVFILYELQGLTGEEIAAAVGCPVKTVWTRLHHARREFLTHYQRARRQQASQES